MQRISALVSLAVFMLVLNWVSYSFDGKSSPPDGDTGIPPVERQPPAEPEIIFNGRIELPDRSELEAPPDSASPKVSDEVAQSEPDPEETPIARKPVKPEDYHIWEDPGKPVDELNTGDTGCGAAMQAHTDDDGFHFLLIGRRTGCPEIGLAMYVTLVPEKRARMTLLNPSIAVAVKGELCPLRDALKQRAGFGELGQALELKTGLHPRFYIDLNLDGFAGMIDMLGGVDYRAARRVSAHFPFLKAGLNTLDGTETITFLQDERVGAAPKETLLVNMLVEAASIDNTSLGLSLLWTGYRNIRSDLSLGDLLELRRITQGISPLTLTLREINPWD